MGEEGKQVEVDFPKITVIHLLLIILNKRKEKSLLWGQSFPHITIKNVVKVTIGLSFPPTTDLTKV